MYYTGFANSIQGKIGYATAPPLPDTLYVPEDHSTIQAAIDAATNGNIVLVAEGTYLENINYKGKAITVASHFLIDGDESHIEKYDGIPFQGSLSFKEMHFGPNNTRQN